MIGLIQMAGFNCALAEDEEDVDFYAIVERRQRRVAVRVGIEIFGDKVKFELPNKHDGVLVMGVIRNSFSNFEVVIIPGAQITSSGTRKGPHTEIVASKRNKGWAVGRHALTVVDDLAADVARAAA